MSEAKTADGQQRKLFEVKYRIILPQHKSLKDSKVHSEMWPIEPGLKLIQSIVENGVFGGDWQEHVSVWSDFDGGSAFKKLDMFVKEDGLRLGLARNEVATTEYRRACQMGLTAVPAQKDPEVLNFIIGPAVLFSRPVWF